MQIIQEINNLIITHNQPLNYIPALIILTEEHHFVKIKIFSLKLYKQ